MDSKDLIKLLRHTVEHGDEEPREYCTNRCGGCELCDQAADAIEALLAERDAAVEDMKGICSFCAHKKTCQFGNHLRDICVNGSNWQWRGPQERGGA